MAVETVDYNWFLGLPNEIILNIFSLLPYRERLHLKLVCKRLYDIACDPHLCRHVAWHHFSSLDVPYLNNLLAQSSTVIRRLELNGNLKVPTFSSQLAKCSNIVSLLLFGVQCTTAELEKVVVSLPSLKHIEFEPCNSPCSMERCKHLMCQATEWKDFLTSTKAMSSLTLATPWNDHFVEFLLRLWSSLGYLPVELNVSLLEESVAADELSARCTFILELWKQCQHVESMKHSAHVAKLSFYLYRPSRSLMNHPFFELHLSPVGGASSAVCVARLVNQEANCDGIIRLCRKSPDSESFCTGYYTYEDQFCLSASEACFKSSFEAVAASITFLNLSGAETLSSANLESIAEVCSSLSQLNIRGCVLSLNPLFGFASIVSNCSSLQGLNVQDISHSAVENTAELWYLLSQVRYLSHLALDPCLLQGRTSEEGELQCFKPDGVASFPEMDEIAGHMEKMTTMVSMEFQTQHQVFSGAVRCKVCKKVSPRCLHLISKFKTLRHLRLEYLPPHVCSALANAALSSCVYLRTLNISGTFAFELSSEALLHSTLQQLYIHCIRMTVTESVIDPLVSNGRLTHLYLFVRTISKTSAFKLFQNLPNLVSCHVYCHKRPVPQPPDEVLEFRRTVKHLVAARVPALEDCVFEEWSEQWSYGPRDFQTHHAPTTRSFLCSELASNWV